MDETADSRQRTADGRLSLEQLVPVPVVVQAGGRAVEITPIRVRELAAFTRAVQPIAAAAAGGADIASLLADHADAVIDATAIGARLERGFVLDLGLDELVELAGAVLTVNVDFFVHRLLPKVTAASEKLATQWAGSTSTPASAPPDSAP